MIPLAQEPWHANSHLRSILTEEWVEAGVVFPWHRVVLSSKHDWFSFLGRGGKPLLQSMPPVKTAAIGNAYWHLFYWKSKIPSGQRVQATLHEGFIFWFLLAWQSSTMFISNEGKTFWNFAGHRKQLRPSPPTGPSHGTQIMQLDLRGCYEWVICLPS